MFYASSAEILTVFAKVEPFLAELRQQRSIPDFLRRTEQVALGFPGAEKFLSQMREQLRAMAQASKASAGVVSGQ